MKAKFKKGQKAKYNKSRATIEIVLVAENINTYKVKENKNYAVYPIDFIDNNFTLIG